MICPAVEWSVHGRALFRVICVTPDKDGALCLWKWQLSGKANCGFATFSTANGVTFVRVRSTFVGAMEFCRKESSERAVRSVKIQLGAIRYTRLEIGIGRTKP